MLVAGGGGLATNLTTMTNDAIFLACLIILTDKDYKEAADRPGPDLPSIRGKVE